MDPPSIEREWSHPSSWAGLVGLWTFDGQSATYRGPMDPNVAYGISIAYLQFRGGVFGADVTLDEPEAAGRLVFGHSVEARRQLALLTYSVVPPRLAELVLAPDYFALPAG